MIFLALLGNLMPRRAVIMDATQRRPKLLQLPQQSLLRYE